MALRGLFLFAVWVFDDTSGANTVAVPRSFFGHLQISYMNSENKFDYSVADLLVPMLGCFHGQVVANCPFKKYWHGTLKERYEIFAEMDKKELEYLRSFHKNCVTKKYR